MAPIKEDLANDVLQLLVGQRAPDLLGREVVEGADELAGAAELVKGNLSRVPVAIIRGHAWERDDSATIAPVLRDQTRDLFR